MPIATNSSFYWYYLASSVLSAPTWGVPIQNAIANSRVIGVALGGILGGPLVGAAARFIADAHRYVIDIGGFTAIACGLATIAAAGPLLGPVLAAQFGFLPGACCGFSSVRSWRGRCVARRGDGFYLLVCAIYEGDDGLLVPLCHHLRKPSHREGFLLYVQHRLRCMAFLLYPA